jgi:hypothetical protein
MVLDASSEYLGAKAASVTVGASTSEMISGDVKVQSGWNTAIFEKYDDKNRTVYQNLLANMNSILLSNNINQIICIGTSQGGVMTTMFASYLAATDMKDRNIQVINFGAPAPGNSNYQNFVNNMGNLAVWKLQNENDPVPFFGIYQQPGHSIRICPLDNGTVDFQVYYLQHGNATMGLAATPDHFFSKFLPRIMPFDVPFLFLPPATMFKFVNAFVSDNILFESPCRFHCVDEGYIPYLNNSKSEYWPSSQNFFEEIENPKRCSRWFYIWCIFF